LTYQSLKELIDLYRELPTIGSKSAERLALFTIQENPLYINELFTRILALKERLGFCERCHGILENEKCPVCDDTRRDQGIICVVEDAVDPLFIERTEAYKGVYHVLGGKISLSEGLSPDKLKIDSLLERTRTEKPQEIIYALSLELKGDMTATFIAEKIFKINPKIIQTRISGGMPSGGEISFADPRTIQVSLEKRSPITVK